MSLMKPAHPLKSALAALAAAALLYTVFTLLFAVIWKYGINISGILTALFLAAAAVLVFYSAVNFIRYFRSSEREKFSCRTLFLFLPAVLIYAGFELYTGYLSNTAEVNRDKLNKNCFKRLDETKLCEALLSGEDPENPVFHKTGAAEMLNGRLPRFRGIYTGDLATSFGTGGKIYLRLGRQALAEMKNAAAKRDSAGYHTATVRFAKVLARAAAVLNDPECAAITLAGEFVRRLESDVSMSFPDDDTMYQMSSAVFECRENFESSIMEFTLYVLQGTLSRFDALKSSPGKIDGMLDPAAGNPVWSSSEIFAGSLFPAARRNRLANDYFVCINYLNNQRVSANSVFSTLNSRLEQMKKTNARCRELNARITSSIASDLSPLMTRAALAQTGIENALIALEVENYRRKNKRLPASLEDIQNNLLQSIPPCHADGSAWRLESGLIGVPGISGLSGPLNIPGMAANKLKHPGFRVYSGPFSFVILDR